MSSNESKQGESTRKLVIIFTILIIVLSMFASIIGVLNYQTLNFTKFITASGQQTEVLSEGIYKYKFKIITSFRGFAHILHFGHFYIPKYIFPGD